MCGSMRRVPSALLAASALLAGCTSSPARHEAAVGTGPTFLLVRHAEKTADDPRDPSLTPAGGARARRLAAEMRDAPLVAVYSTDTRRARSTALPAARMHGLAVTAYDARKADAFARELRARHPAGLVLIVGHSNTVPALAAALCGCTVAPMTGHEYGLRYRLRAGTADAAARLEAEPW
jgi:broad specificity phosphatase PhoE